MTLGDKRREFSGQIAELVLWAIGEGYQCMFEEIKRGEAQAQSNAASGAGITNSLHLIGLAADISIFKDGRLLESVEEYRPIGEKWKSLHAENAWGGDFVTRPDADHFSRSHNGVR